MMLMLPEPDLEFDSDSSGDNDNMAAEPPVADAHDGPPLVPVPPGDHISLHATAVQLGVTANNLAARTPHAHNVPDAPEPPTDLFQLEGESFFFEQDGLETEYEGMLRAKGGDPID